MNNGCNQLRADRQPTDELEARQEDLLKENEFLKRKNNALKMAYLEMLAELAKRSGSGDLRGVPDKLQELLEDSTSLEFDERLEDHGGMVFSFGTQDSLASPSSHFADPLLGNVVVEDPPPRRDLAMDHAMDQAMDLTSPPFVRFEVSPQADEAFPQESLQEDPLEVDETALPEMGKWF